MKQHYSNDLMKSVYCYVDNLICSKAGGFYNTSFILSPAKDSELQGYMSFVPGVPIRQFVNDTSVPNRIAPTFTPGVAGISVAGFSHGKGTVYCSVSGPSDPSLYTNSLQGQASVKDFAIYLSNKSLNSILEDNDGYSAIYVQVMSAGNQPFCFGRVFNTIYNVRLTVITDKTSGFDAVYGFLMDQKMEEIPYVQYQGHGGDFPFGPFNPIGAANSFGNFTYDYDAIKVYSEVLENGDPAGPPKITLWNAKSAGLRTSLGKFKNTNREFFMGFIDCEIQVVRSVGDYLPNP